MHRAATLTSTSRGLAALQHGLITSAQMRALGYSRDAIAGLVDRGALARTGTGLLRVVGTDGPGGPGSVQALTAVVLLSRTPIAVSHGSAARLWGFGELGEGWCDLTVEPGRHLRRHVDATYHLRALPPGSVAERSGLPVTDPVRTLADLALQRWDRALLTRFVDHLLKVRHVGVRDLLLGAERLGVHAGRAAVALLLAGHLEGARLDDTQAAIDREGWVRRIAAAAGLPPLVPQHGVDLGDRMVWIDLAFPSSMVAIEFDSWQWHAGRTRFDADRRRWDDLAAAGWRVVVLTSAMSEAEVVRRIARAVAASLQPTG